MIVLMFIILAINYIMMSIGIFFPHSLDWIGDWLVLYVIISPRITWLLAILAGGVFWYYKRWVLFWLNIVGLIFFYVPLIKYYV